VNSWGNWTCPHYIVKYQYILPLCVRKCLE
jgi:hypothetical protein